MWFLFKKIGVRFSASLSESPPDFPSHTFHEQAQYHIYINKKRSPEMELLKKIGGGLLFHEQAQYHRR